MPYTILVPALIVGFLLGLGVVVLFRIVQRKTSKELAQSLIAETKAESGQSTQALMNQMKDSFGSLSVDALTKVSGEVVKLAGETFGGQQRQSAMDLEAKKGLIDQQLAVMNTQLDTVQKLMQSLETDRERKFGELASQLKLAGEQTALLGKTTGALREALASTRARGQWGERMANDVLRISGLKEGINYRRQTVQQETGNRPDFTFLLPHGLTLNMDVKFPLDNYLKAINAESPDDAEKHATDFIGDVRARIKEITTREYIDEDHGTVSCVLLFVPVESVFAFAQENDAGLIDYALKYHVVLCSPSTLFAVLAVIHQAVDTFAVEQRSREILAILGAFGKQWKAFVAEFDKLGKHLRQANEDYAELMDTRARLLQRKIDDVDRLREQEGVALLPETDAIEAGAEVKRDSRSSDTNET
jgi:DNA recombination protein RmuC